MGSPKEFHGGVFAQDLPGGRAPARIDVLPDGLRACTSDNRTFELSYDSLELELGGASGRMMFCRNADKSITFFCEEHGFIFALTRVAGKHVSKQLVPMQSRLRRQSVMRAAGWTAAAVVAVVVLWGLPSMVRWSLRSVVHTVPLSVDRTLGSETLKHMDLGGPEADAPAIREALVAILKRLSSHTDVPKEVEFVPHLIRRDAVNAFALPGGPVVVYTGLLREATSPEAVAAVLAHEMAHVIHRHGLERIAQSMGIITTMHFFFGDVAGLLAVGQQILTTAAVNHYSRAEEAEADRTAVALLQAAAIDPRALADFFVTLQKDPTLSAQDALAFTWISDHPSLADRIAAARVAAADLPQVAWQPLISNWAALQQQLPN